MEKKVAKTKEEIVIPGRSLVDLVLSWSIRDVLNQDLYRNQVYMLAIVLMFMCIMHLKFLILSMTCFLVKLWLFRG